MDKISDKFRGCLIGGAVGDALGYPIEFMDISQIQNKYGPHGIRKYDKCLGCALISDDTQMTAFTAAGVIIADLSNKPDEMSSFIFYNYLNWLKTQRWDNKCAVVSWLYNLRDLHTRRAPGNTCLSALRSGEKGTIDNPINGSKGCGGVMRVAPIGLYFSNKHSEDAVDEAAKAAAITHGHVLGYTSAGLLAYIVSEAIRGDKDILDIINTGNNYCNSLYGDDYTVQYEQAKKAIEFANNSNDDVYNIENIGGGWTGEDAIAIAIYCVLKYKNDFTKAVVAAVNHSGDSDSTGAIVGNIMGALLGYKKIPRRYTDSIELHASLTELADDLYNCSYNHDSFIDDASIKNKYVLFS